MSSPPLTPPPVDLPEAGPSSPRSADKPSTSSKSYLLNGRKPQSEISDDIDDASPTKALEQVGEAKKRHQADLVKHSYEPPKADNPQNDWQVAYVWAFIVKFNQKERIKRLECLEDFEKALQAQVAERPDDVLEGVLVRFLLNLKPGLRNLDCENIQSQLSSYISDHLLNSSEFTVWDRPWAPNEEARGSCCSSAPDRLELGRLRYPGEPLDERVEKNPLIQQAKKGGGLFELDWRERAKLLRQMVDWQLSHCEVVRAVINREHGLSVPKHVKIPESQGVVATPQMGLDRNKNRIWAFDNSGRLYRSGNPFKRPCPMFALSSNKTEFADQVSKWESYGRTPLPPIPSESGKIKGAKAKEADKAAKKVIKGIEDEKALGVMGREMVDLVEKEEVRIIRARKRLADAQKFQVQAEFRSTRTRRPTRKVDYTYDGFDEDEEEVGSRRSRRSDNTFDSAVVNPLRPLIPGERTSARLRAKDHDDTASYVGSGINGDGPGSSRANSPQFDPDASTSSHGTSMKEEEVEQVEKKVKAAKGYAWIVEPVNNENATEAMEEVPALPEAQHVGGGGDGDVVMEERPNADRGGDNIQDGQPTVEGDGMWSGIKRKEFDKVPVGLNGDELDVPQSNAHLPKLEPDAHLPVLAGQAIAEGVKVESGIRRDL